MADVPLEFTLGCVVSGHDITAENQEIVHVGDAISPRTFRAKPAQKGKRQGIVDG
jgi:hypothetical protein